MNATTSPWIQSSLARLESLEVERDRLAARGETDNLTVIEEEIRSLYAILEAAATESEGDQEQAQSESPHAPVHPFVAPPPSPTTWEPLDEQGTGDDLEGLERSGGRAGWLVAAALVLAAGAGGAWYALRPTDTATTSDPTTQEVRVIQAGAVVPDTQGPKAAKGADVERTAEPVFERDTAKPSRPSPSPRPASSDRSKAPETRSGKRRLNVDDSDDPLAGLK